MTANIGPSSLPVPMEKFGRLTLLSEVGMRAGTRLWLARCDCGVEKLVNVHHVRKGAIKSCGCLKAEHRKGGPLHVPNAGLTKTVAEMVQARGSATADDLLPDLPAYSREKVLNAMKNARSAGLIHCRLAPRKGRVGVSGSDPAIHYPGACPKGMINGERVAPTRPQNSVWELAAGREIIWAGLPQVVAGRRFCPLGGWDENEERATT